MLYVIAGDQSRELKVNKIIKEIKNSIKIPVIAGGLIKDKSDVISALEAGAYGVSSTSKDVWNM